LSGIRTHNRQKIMGLTIGMTKQEVLSAVGTKTIFPVMGERVSNPYKGEVLVGENRNLEVLYYYTDSYRVDFGIRDDELTPVVFDNGRLIGWGWPFFNESVKKYDLKVSSSTSLPKSVAGQN